jgi:hypothetical protein
MTLHYQVIVEIYPFPNGVVGDSRYKIFYVLDRRRPN